MIVDSRLFVENIRGAIKDTEEFIGKSNYKSFSEMIKQEVLKYGKSRELREQPREFQRKFGIRTKTHLGVHS